MDVCGFTSVGDSYSTHHPIQEQKVLAVMPFDFRAGVCVKVIMVF